MIEYVGARWLKCDFHLHTTASKCFIDKSVTPEMWVQSCLNQKLDCVAVTDHNTNAGIDAIKQAAIGTSLTVFPGVELTCDTSKIHLLVIFNKDKTGQDVYDFLIACGINRSDFSSSDAHCTLSCLDVVNKAKDVGALVIPAHIDEFNGLGLLSKNVIKSFLEHEDIVASQFVTPQFLASNFIIDEDFCRTYNQKYGRAEGTIGAQSIKDYYACVQEAVRNNVSLVTFSDNPDDSDSSKHGLSGIGKAYTWIKMDKEPSLEGIRLALMAPNRVKNCIESKYLPYKEPSLWIKSIEIKNSTLTKVNDSFRMEFNPQLNTIIGGRGSGKSSVFRFMRGAFHKMNDIKGLQEIKEEQDSFFRKSTEGKGVLKDETEILVEFIRDGILHQVKYVNSHQNTVLRFEGEHWVEIEDEAYINFFDFEQYTQKQIFAIAKNPNALKELIDFGTDEISKLNQEKMDMIQSYISTYKQLKNAAGCKTRINQLDTEIKDLKLKIENLNSSNITTTAQEQTHFTTSHERIESYFELIQQKLAQLSESSENNVFPAFILDDFETKYKEEIRNLLGPLENKSKDLAVQINEAVNKIKQEMKNAYTALQYTQFEKDRILHNETYENKKKELLDRGIDDIFNYQAYTEKLQIKDKEHKELSETTIKIPQYEQELKTIKESIFNRQKEISQKRQDIVNKLSTNKVKINVRPMSDRKKFEQQFREIIQKNSGYDSDLEKIISICFPQSTVQFDTNYQKIIEDLHIIRSGHDSELGFGGWFMKMVRELNDEQISRIETLVPDDQIDVLYKPNGSSNFKSIVSASAGQKTTAVLTYILSQGSTPLLLDQPEDDLDNRLVCDLVVEKIQQIKETRQVIVITHNANIPVIGDAEHIVSMDSTSKYLKIHTEGVLENKGVKKEICEIMEGGEDAFKLRALRYKSIFK